MPYLLRNDDIIAAALLLSFVFIVWAVARSWAYLEAWRTDFFNAGGKRKKFTKLVGVQLNGYVPIVVSVSLLFGILVTGYVQREAPEVMAHFTPQGVFAIGAGGVLGVVLLKLLLYFLINATFFRREQTADWTQAYVVTLLMEAVLLLPLVVATVYLNTPAKVAFWWLLTILAIVEFVRLIKLKVTFFHGMLGYVHIFLYFCTLNLATDLITWRLLTQIKLLLDIVR